MIVTLHTPDGPQTIDTDTKSDVELEALGLLRMVKRSPERRLRDIQTIIDASDFSLGQKAMLKTMFELALHRELTFGS